MLFDGLQILALQTPQGMAHAPFFAPLFKFIAEAQNLDDLTLLLAALPSGLL